MSKVDALPQNLYLHGPKTIPLLGWRGRLLQFAHHPIFFMEKLHQEFGEIVAVTRGHQSFTFLFGPEYNQQILKNPQQFYSYDLKASPLPFPEDGELMKMNTGLSLVNGDQHRRLRRLMLPFFQKRHITTYHQDIVTLSEKMLATWQIGQPLNLLKEMEKIALWVSVKALFGLEQNQQGIKLVRMLENMMSNLYSLPAILLPFNVPGLPFWRLVKRGDRLSLEIQALINRKRAQADDQNDILSHLLWLHDESDTKLSDEELIGQVLILFRGSYPSTASALTWTIFLLLQHPAVLADLLDELNQTVGQVAPSPEQLAQLPLLEAVINESMRLLPPTPWVLRYNSEPVSLGPYVFEEKTTFVLGIYNTHRLPELYPEPRRFLPQRWQTFSPSPYEYLPFTAGPRLCLGATFAKMLMKIILATALQTYSFSLPPGTRVNATGLRGLIPANGLPVLVNGPGHIPGRTDVRGNIHKLVDW